MFVFPLPVMPWRSFVGVLVEFIESRAVFWAGFRGIFRDFRSSREELTGVDDKML